MKNFRKFSFLLLVPFFIGMATMLGGIITDNETLITVAKYILFLGMPVCMFLFLIVGFIILRKEKADKSRYNPYEETAAKESRSGNGETSLGANERAEELEEINEINSSYGYESRAKSYEYHERHTERKHHYSSDKERLFAKLFFGFLIVDFALIIIFGFLKLFVGSIVCFILFVVPLIVFIVVVKSRERLSYSGGKINADGSNVFYGGVVKFCVMSSSKGKEDGYWYLTTRIKSVNYKISIDYDGKEFVAYTRKFYNEGETVNFVVVKGNLVSVVE